MTVADDLAKSAAKIAERALKERTKGNLQIAKILAQQAASALAFAKALGWKAPTIGPN